jgi:2-keto-4-pentenoate hydratase/2-oxohepta-3-ene-1,7-dioic acid hydratase in catechol pathway
VKLASHRHEGRASWGVVVDDAMVDGKGLLQGRFASLRALLDAGALEELGTESLAGATRIPLTEVDWLPTIPDPEKILCVGLNYRDHAAEVGRELPPHPSVFVRLANTLLPPGGAVVRPSLSVALDFEGELGVVIGRGGRHIARANALSHIAGYTCFNDVSVRDFQKQSVTAGKNFPATAPMGPWLVTPDSIPDPGRLTLTTRLNGSVVQQAGTDTLIYDIPTIIAYLSQFTPLAPGDVIATGTPAGVGSGRRPPLWMKPGDVIEVDIDKVGLLRNHVVEEEVPGSSSTAGR